jgi:hypothetical protein
LAIIGSAHANVYKCQLPNKETTYQDAPCSPNTADKNIVKIPTQTPEQKEAALNKLKALEAERQALDKGNKAPQESLEKKEPQAIAEKTATGEIIYYPYRGRPKSPAPSYGPRYTQPRDYRNPNYGYRNPYPYISSDLGNIPYTPNNPNAHFPANSEARSMQGFPVNSPASPNFSPFHH